MSRLTAGYRLCARSEGKSRNTADIVASSVASFAEFRAISLYHHTESFMAQNKEILPLWVPSSDSPTKLEYANKPRC